MHVLVYICNPLNFTPMSLYPLDTSQNIKVIHLHTDLVHDLFPSKCFYILATRQGGLPLLEEPLLSSERPLSETGMHRIGGTGKKQGLSLTTALTESPTTTTSGIHIVCSVSHTVSTSVVLVYA